MSAPGELRKGGALVDRNHTDRAAVALSAFQIENRLNHAFRSQDTSDYGVDAHVEIMRGDVATGRLVGLQIKGGPSYFGEETPEAWKYRPSKRHIRYWLGHSLPMFLLLVDLVAETIYWQEVSERTLQTGPKGGTFVLVPRTQTLDSAAAAWETAADRFADIAGDQYEDNLNRLPPHVAQKLKSLDNELQGQAALLAAHLAHGRGAPKVVLRTLLESDPPWLAALGPSSGLAIMADYAHAHDLNDIGAEALLRAAERDAANVFRYTKHAGLILIGSDREKARQLLDSVAPMPGADGDPRLAVGYAILDHPADSANPVALSPEVEARLDAVQDDDLVLAFLARRREHAGDLDSAAAYADNALATSPEAAHVMELLAQILTRRARSPRAHPGDQTRAIRLAIEAVDQLHRWSGPTESALETLLQSQMSAGDFSGALNRALPVPDGQATHEESRRPAVQAVAALAATALEKADLAAKVVEEMPDGVDKQVVLARIKRAGGSEEEQRENLLALLPDLDETRPEALLQIVMRLSDLGVDESARLDVMVDRGLITPNIRDVVSVTASAVKDLTANLPALRVLADSEEIAAAKIVDLLAHAKRYDDAEAAADAAYLRFGTPDFAVRRCELLRYIGRGEEAADVANDVLTLSTLDPLNRRIAHRILARHFIDQAARAQAGNTDAHWRRAERQLLECVNADSGIAADDNDVWQLAEVQLQLGESDRAYLTTTTYDPAITHLQEAKLWLAVVGSQATLPQSAYARMLDLADEYAEDATLSAAFLTTVVTRTRDADDGPATPADNRPVVDGDLRSTAFSALQAHVERHGADSPIRVVEAPSTEDLIAKMTEMMRRDDAPLVELVELIRQARLPLGFLATAAGRPYSAMLATRPLGYYLAAEAIDHEDALDETAAGDAIGADVVADSSALLVATELGEYPYARGLFRGVLIARATSQDLVGGRLDLDGRSASSGFMAYDSASDSIGAVEIDIDEHLGALNRLSNLERAASSAQIVTDVGLEGLPGLDLPNADPWLAGIALARARGVAFWSDDVAQRRLARALGVPSFGTMTLQQVRTADALEVPGLTDEAFNEVVARRREEIVAAVASRIVDVPTDATVVVEQGRAEDWSPAVGLVTVGRPGWWHLAINPWRDLQTILQSALEDGAELDQWRYHAMWGVARLAGDEPSRTATLLAAVALLPLGNQIDEDEAVRHLAAAHEIAKLRKAHRPSDYLSEAATTLVEAQMLGEVSEVVTRIRSRLADDT